MESIEMASKIFVTSSINDPELGNMTISIPENAINNSAVWDFPVHYVLEDGANGSLDMSGYSGSFREILTN